MDKLRKRRKIINPETYVVQEKDEEKYQRIITGQDYGIIKTFIIHSQNNVEPIIKKKSKLHAVAKKIPLVEALTEREEGWMSAYDRELERIAERKRRKLEWEKRKDFFRVKRPNAVSLKNLKKEEKSHCKEFVSDFERRKIRNRAKMYVQHLASLDVILPSGVIPHSCVLCRIRDVHVHDRTDNIFMCKRCFMIVIPPEEIDKVDHELVYEEDFPQGFRRWIRNKLSNVKYFINLDGKNKKKFKKYAFRHLLC
jgi:hypothetical protein